MDFMTTTAAFVVVLGIIIFVHEFGHFITAKAFGMRVFVFSFGFGRRLLGFKWGDTDCRLSLVPLGGYVKLEGEPDDALSEDTSTLGDGRDFTSRPRWQRIIVYLAGPAMNGLLTVSRTQTATGATGEVSVDTELVPARSVSHKVLVCHDPADPHTISIAAPALKAHLAHGDTMGACQ